VHSSLARVAVIARSYAAKQTTFPIKELCSLSPKKCGKKEMLPSLFSAPPPRCFFGKSFLGFSWYQHGFNKLILCKAKLGPE
jgi:hypothetical protein